MWLIVKRSLSRGCGRKCQDQHRCSIVCHCIFQARPFLGTSGSPDKWSSGGKNEPNCQNEMCHPPPSTRPQTLAGGPSLFGSLTT